MNDSWFRRNASRLVGLALLVAFYGFARLPSLSDNERRSMASRFQFTRILLPEIGTPTHRADRQVHPSVRHISGWISSVGASIALHDLDGDGLSNDLCWIDPRNDSVVVGAVPGTETRTPGSRTRFALESRAFETDSTVAPMGCLPGDFNEDGSADLLIYYWGRPPRVYLRRLSDEVEEIGLSPASFRPVEITAEKTIWNTNAATLADVDGDGHVDLIFGNYFQDGAAMLDPRGDGRVSMQDSMSRATNGGTNRILLWSAGTSGPEPTVSFREAVGVLDSEVAGGWTLAVGAADLDGDQLPEIYFANDFGSDRLLHNRSRPGQPRLVVIEGNKRFRSPNSKVIGRDSFKGMGIDFGDLNSDGILDLYVSNIANEYALEESHFLFLSTGDSVDLASGRLPWSDESESLGLSRSGFSWEARLADFDNDGTLEAMQATGFVRGTVNRWPELQELALENDRLIADPRSWPRFGFGDDLSGHLHNPFFVRSQSGRYFDIASELKLDQAQVTRGIAVSDVDGDGDLDFAIANQWDHSYFVRNDSPRLGSFLQLNLMLPVTGRDALRPAIGATASVKLPDGRRAFSFVDGGNGHSGVRGREIHLGLGEVTAGSDLAIEIRWRDSDGEVRMATYRRPPGRHTIVLGATEAVQ